MKDKIFKYFLISFSISVCSLVGTSGYSQTAKKKPTGPPPIVAKTDAQTKKQAAYYFKSEAFGRALNLYLSLQLGDTANMDYNYKVALCYLNLNLEKSKAIPFLERVVGKEGAPLDAWFLLGKTYHFSNRFDLAIETYQKFLGFFPGGKGMDKADLAEVNRSIEMCGFGKGFVENPVDVIFENLGPLINSPYPDYNPFISSDERIMIYSTRRPGSGLPDDLGIFNADIYFSLMKEYKWTKARSIGPNINSTANDEEALSLTPDGKMLLIYSNTVDGMGIGDVYFSTLKGKTWSKAVAFGENINTADLETGATISPDGNTMIFASDHPFVPDKSKSIKDKDLYKCYKLPDGKWSNPVPLGQVLNTRYDEDAPYFHADGKTLYFSSKGHTSMGGFDVFKSTWDQTEDTWSEPENLGYPINNADDNLYFSLSVQGKYAYICAVRPEGLGDLDIYKINFKTVPRNSYSTIIRGQVLDADSTVVQDVKITLMNKQDPDQFGQYKSNPSSGKYVVSTGPGKFMLMVDAPGFQTFKEEITIPEIEQPEFIEKIIVLKRKEGN